MSYSACCVRNKTELMIKYSLSLPLLISSITWAKCPDWSKDQAYEQLARLSQEIQYHNHLYFQQNAPVISDQEFDALTARLRTLSECFPTIELKQDEVLTVTDETETKIRHQAFMGSLRKAENKNDIAEFLHNAESSAVILQPKIDGIAIELVYEQGKLVAASTRGDGTSGKNILEKIKAIPGVPKEVFSGFSRIVLHGELFARLDLWRLLPGQEKQVKNRYSSARHFVAGIIHSNQPQLDDLEMLDFFPWCWVDNPFTSESLTTNQLYGLGFDLPAMYTRSVSRLADVIKLRSQLEQEAKKQPFLMDGIVLKIDDLSVAKELGWSGNTPNYALAWKFPPATAISTVIRIEFRVGRTGNITPVVHFEPVQIKGETITKVSLGSINHLRKKDIAAGDDISVVLKGAATPVFSKIMLRASDRKKTVYPDPDRYNGFTCLSISEDCEDQFVARLKWMALRLDLPGLDEDIIRALVQQGVVKELVDLFKVSWQQLMDAGVSGERANHILAAIGMVREVPFEQQIRALGIPGVGKKKSEVLSRRYSSWFELAAIGSNTDSFIKDIRKYLEKKENISVIRVFSQ